MSTIVGQRRWETFVAAGFALLAGYAVAGGNAPVAIAVVTGTVAVAAPSTGRPPQPSRWRSPQPRLLG